jgi:phage FluMu protein Com
MQLRCYNCHKPFALSTLFVHVARDMMSDEKLQLYNAQCPHCRRVNRISFEELKRSAPDWEPSSPRGEVNE